MTAAASSSSPSRKAVTILMVDHVSQLSGGERSLLELACGLDRRRWTPVLAVPEEGPLTAAFRAAGLEVHGVGGPTGLWSESRERLGRSPARLALHVPALVGPARRLARLARDVGAAVIHTNSLKAHVVGGLAGRLAHLPVIWHVRDILPPGWLARSLALLGRGLARHVVAISDAVAQAFTQAGFPAGRVTTVHNGITPQGPGSPTLRSQLNLEPRQVLVGQVCQIARWKGPHVLLEALATCVDLSGAIVGKVLFEGNESDYGRALEARVSQPDLRGRVHLVGARDDMADVWASLDILAHPVLEPEPFGRVLIEAMSAGVPVVASRCGATGEVLGDSAGLLVEPGDPTDLALALDRLARDRALRQRMGDAGRLRASGRFSLSSTCAHMDEIFDSVLGSDLR